MEVLVTGGDTDLGRMVAEGFRDAGHRVVIAGARRDDLEVAAKELDVDAIVFDNTDPASLEEVRGQFPHQLDTIVNVPAPRAEAGDPRTYSLADLAAAWRNALNATAVSAVSDRTDPRRSSALRRLNRQCHPRAAPRRHRRGRRQGRHFGLDRRTGHTLRRPRHHRQHGGVRPQRRAGLRRPVPHAGADSRRDRPAVVVPHHSCRSTHHGTDAARQPWGTGKLRLIFPRSPEAKTG